MSTFTVLPIHPAPIPEQKFARNGDTAIAPVMRRIAGGYNFVSASQRKHIFSAGITLLRNPVTDPQDANYFCFRTGANVGSVTFMAAMQPAFSTSTAKGSIQMTLYDGTNTLTSDVFYHPARNGVGDSTVIRVRGYISVAEHTLLPDTEYVGYFTQGARAQISSLSVFETASPVVDSSDEGCCDPSHWEVFKSVTDEGCKDLADTGAALHEKNGAQLICWNHSDAAARPAALSATAENMIDGTAAWAATSTGFVLHSQYLDTQNADVQIVIGVHAERITGTGTLSVSLLRTGSTIASVTGIVPADMAPFSSTATTITARASDKIDIHIAATQPDSTEWAINAVGVWLYQ